MRKISDFPVLRYLRGALVASSGVALLGAAAVLVPATLASLDRVDPVRVQSAAGAYPNFTLQQQLAAQREAHAQLRPSWGSLTWTQRAARATAVAQKLLVRDTSASVPTAAAFLGNFTLVKSPTGGQIELQRQSDCSLTLGGGTFSFNLTSTFTLQSTTANYERTLHNEAGLTTPVDAFPNHCSDPTIGIGSRAAGYLGAISATQQMAVAAAYNMSAGTQSLFYDTYTPSSQSLGSLKVDSSMPQITQVAVGDLDGDGLTDVVGLDSTGADLNVWLTHADGTLSAPTAYTLTGNVTEAAVVADVNGDGKLDIVVATRDSSNQEYISVLTGKGDGTLNAPQTMSIATASALSHSYLVHNLVAADIRGTGHPDIVGSNGLLLLNNGSGTFTAGASAFVPEAGISSLSPNLVAADFNNDGKIDIAVGSGISVSLYLGKGDGTFTVGASYASVNDDGYLTATDLDGDGNIDIYVGMANGGLFAGSPSDSTRSYALMGNGDGTFRGAPLVPFVYTGHNMADLDGDKIMDAVGANPDGSLTSYLGDGKGGFTSTSTLVTSPVTIGGQAYTVAQIQSYTLGDVNGDGVPDLAYIGSGFNGPGGTPGIFIALGEGHGGFAAPTFYSIPSTLTSGAIDIDWSISNLHLADLNGDGKGDLIYNYQDASSQDSNVYFGTAVQLGNGDGTFQAVHAIAYRSTAYNGGFFSAYDSEVELVADLNKDGKPDLVLITQTGTIDSWLSTPIANIQVALGNGDGTFSVPATVTGPDIMVNSYHDRVPASIAVVDMNGDGVVDLVAVGSTTSTYKLQVGVSLGNGDGTFKAPTLTAFAGQYLNTSQGLAVADFDGDGKLDVAIVDPYVPGNNGILLGNGDGTLQGNGTAGAVTPKLVINLPSNAAVTALDLNGDGLPDMIAGNVEFLSANPGGGGGTPPPAQPDFALTSSANSGTVAAGNSATATLTLTPSGGFNQSVALTCSGLPTGAACSFSAASVTVSGSSATSTLTISTTGGTALNSPGQPFDPLVPGGVLLAGLGLPTVLRRRGRWIHLRNGMLLVMIVLSSLAMNGCGGGGGSSSGSGSSGGSSGTGGGSGGSTTTRTPAGTYTITVKGSAGATAHSLSYSLTVS